MSGIKLVSQQQTCWNQLERQRVNKVHTCLSMRWSVTVRNAIFIIWAILGSSSGFHVSGAYKMLHIFINIVNSQIFSHVHHDLLISIIKEIAITCELIWIFRWNQLLQRVKTGIFFFTLCSINLNIDSISGMGNIQPVFNLDPCIMKHLWCDTVDSSINSFLQVWWWWWCLPSRARGGS